mgnify:CR=1 FL=1
MTTIGLGTQIHDIRGKRLGEVRAVNSCCIQSTEGANIQRDAILNVQEFGVELICDADQISRYACKLHTRSNGTTRSGGAD